MGKVKLGRKPSGRPQRVIVAVRLDPSVVEQLRELARNADRDFGDFIRRHLTSYAATGGKQ